MKARHAAALALVGWYLMCPPLCSSSWNKDQMSSCSRGEFNYEAPLDRWFESGEFNSLRKSEISAAEKSAKAICKCVSTDDPRLGN